jgi:hypothetical protein
VSIKLCSHHVYFIRLLPRDFCAAHLCASSSFHLYNAALLKSFTMSATHDVSLADPEKHGLGDPASPPGFDHDGNGAVEEPDQRKLHRNLKGRHMQMIAM